MANPTNSIPFTSCPAEVTQHILKFVGDPAITRLVSQFFKAHTDEAINSELQMIWIHLHPGQTINPETNLPPIKEIYKKTLQKVPQNPHSLPPVSFERFVDTVDTIKLEDTLTFWKSLRGGKTHIARENLQGLSLDEITDKLSTWIEGTPLVKNLRELHLSNKNLQYLPQEILQLTELRTLSLHNNHLTALPQDINQLLHLEFLHLSDNHLTMLPKSISQLEKLSNLYISNNQLTELPQAMENLTKHSKFLTLRLDNNLLTALPEILNCSDVKIGLSPFTLDKVRASIAYRYFQLSPDQKNAVYGRISELARESGVLIEPWDHEYGKHHVFDSEERLVQAMNEILETPS
ncbi:MAG: leucine-rich repeat domain-containing protein [Simkaniaceae bacterium]|nr:leucine-rich repeat domain-containing protein [Simkaniaceae bacterium]